MAYYNHNSSMMVRKHQTIQRQRQYRQRVLSWWIKLSSPVFLLLIFCYGTSLDVRWFLRNTDDDNDSSKDAATSSNKKKSISGLWMMQNESSSCIPNILDYSNGETWKGLFDDDGRANVETILMESLACFKEENSTSVKRTHIRSVWIAGSTAAAGYGNQKHQSYPEIVTVSSGAAAGRVSTNVGRDATEFPLAWCHGHRGDATTMVVYDFQDDLHHFKTTRLQDFVTFVQPQVLVVRLSNDHDLASQQEIVEYLQSLPAAEMDGTTTTTIRTRRCTVYVIDVSAVADGVFGVAHSPDALHAHHLTVAQHERVAQILQVLMRYHGLDDDDEQDDDEPEQLYTTTNAQETTTNDAWHCASGFGDATTTGRTPSSLQFVKQHHAGNITTTNSITLATVLPNCCGNSMDSVLLPNQELRQIHWMWDALDANAKRRGLPFDQYGHTDWKLVVSGTPSSSALKVVLPSSLPSSDVVVGVTYLRICGDCKGMIVSGDDDVTALQSVGYGCFDVNPPTAAFSISVSYGACQISHILWQ